MAGADLMTIREIFGKDLRGRKITVSWAYAPSYAKPMSVPQGLALLMTRFGLDVTLAHPPEYKLMDSVMQDATENARQAGVKLEVVDDMDAAFENADVAPCRRPQICIRLARGVKTALRCGFGRTAKPGSRGSVARKPFQEVPPNVRHDTHRCNADRRNL